MAIYHFAIQVISRSKGRSALACAAYRAGKQLVDERDGTVHDYSDKEVDHAEILAPKDAPVWAYDRERLWNEVEKRELRVDSQLAREIRMALPIELNDGQQLKLVRRFLLRECVTHGMVADFAIHRDNPKNPHVHVLLTMRTIDREGFGHKERSWNRKEVNERWRAGWAHEVNRSLQRAGHRVRVDHRSFIARGIELIPTVKVGVARFIWGTRGKDLLRERTLKNDRAATRNGEKICKDPKVALKAMMERQAVFSRRDLAIWLNTHTHGAEQHARAMSAVMCDASILKVGHNKRREELFTTRGMLELEKGMLGRSESLTQQIETHKRSIEAFQTRLDVDWTLSPEQSRAVRHIVRETEGIALVEGVAGSGKSYLVDAARDAWALEGRRVYGAALSGKAAEGLAEGARIDDCRSIASWEQSWAKDRDLLKKGDVLVVDEAGMVGTRQLSRIMDHAERAGAKLVLVGDPEQLQAIEAGSPFRALCELHGKAELLEVRRQRHDWMREATKELSRGEVGAAVNRYYEAGMVHDHKDKADALAEIMRQWENDEKKEPGKSQVVLTHTRADARDLNVVLHELRKHMGKLGAEEQILTEQGHRQIAVGDRVVFTKNSKNLGVRNGTLGIVTEIKGGKLEVQLDGSKKRASKTVAVDTRRFKHLDHGYALTTAKSQGLNAERAYVLASKGYDRHTAYVAITRHIDRVDIHYSREEFPRERGGLVGGLQREGRKRLALDFVKDERAFRSWAHEEERTREGAMKQTERPIKAGSLKDMARRYEAAKAIAEVGPLTRRTALARLPEVKALHKELKEAVADRTFWTTKQKEWQKEHPLKSRVAAVPTLRPRLEPEVACPRTGQVLGLHRGRENAEERVALVREKLIAVRQQPELVKQAAKTLTQHNAAFRQAGQRMAFLEKSIELVRGLRDRTRGMER